MVGISTPHCASLVLSHKVASTLLRYVAACASQKYVWLQGRQVWMFSKLFNELSDEQWVEQYTARHGEGGELSTMPRFHLFIVPYSIACLLVRASSLCEAL